MTLRINYTKLSVSVCYGTVLFPFDVRELARLLRDDGYTIADALQGPYPRAARLDVGGVIARKLDTAVRIDTRGQVLGIEAPDVPRCLGELDSIESLLESQLGVSGTELGRYYELLADAVIPASADSSQAWSAHMSGVPIVAKLSDALGKEIAAYGLRLVSRDSVPNQENWLDVHMEPFVLSPHDRHHVSLVFRDRNRDEVVRFARSLGPRLQALLDAVEEQ